MFITRPKFDPRARFRVTSHRGVDLGDRIIPEGELIPDGVLDHMQLLALYCTAVIDPIAQELPEDPFPGDPDEDDEFDATRETPPIIKARRKRAA